MRGNFQSSIASRAFAAVSILNTTEKNDLPITEKEQNFIDKIKGRDSEIHEAIEELGIPNNPPFCSLDTTRTFETEIDELVFKARVALLPILLEAVKGNEACMEAYAYLRPHLGISIPDVLCEFLRSISYTELKWTEALTIDVSKVIKESDSKHLKLDDKDTSKKVDYSYLIDFSSVHASRFGTIFDYNGPLTAEVVNAESKDKKGKVIITTPFCTVYSEILCAAVLEDLSLWTTEQLSFGLRSLYSNPVDRTSSIDLYCLLPESMKAMITLSDEYKESLRVLRMKAWSFLDDLEFKDFLEAERQATDFCRDNALGPDVRKNALDKYLKNLNLDSMNLYLESKALAESLATVISPKLPKEDRIAAKVETPKPLDAAQVQQADVPQSLISALKARFPSDKDKEIQKIGRRIVSDARRYSINNDEALKLVKEISAKSLQDLGNIVHASLSGNGKPQAVIGSNTPSGATSEVSIDEVIQGLVSFMQEQPENKANKSELQSKIPESYKDKTDTILDKMLDEGLLMPLDDEYLLNPALWA